MILITGATGNNGQELVRQLIALGQPIRALVRNPEEANGIKGPNVELAVGDFDRTETLDTALRNIDKAFLLTPAAERFVQWQVAFIEAAQLSDAVPRLLGRPAISFEQFAKDNRGALSK